MNEHVTQWLGAYHDGELGARRRHQVEHHLADCAACRAEMDDLDSLSALLQESPKAEGLLPPDRFVAQVGLRLERRPERTALQRTLEYGWRMIPAGLAGAWVFVQAVFLVAGIVLIVLQVGAGLGLLGLQIRQGETWLTGVLGLMGTELGETSRAALHTLHTTTWLIALYLTATVAIGLMYWSWLATAWARRRHQMLRAR